MDKLVNLEDADPDEVTEEMIKQLKDNKQFVINK